MPDATNIEVKRFSIRQCILSFGYAFKGIRSFFISTQNAWIHSFIAILVTIAGFSFHVDIVEWIALVFAIGMVFTAEAFNTAVEEWVNAIQTEHDQKAGNVKDISAGAVLMAAISAAIIGLLIFVPKIYAQIIV